MKSLNPRLEVLPEAQRVIWNKLGWTKSSGFVLYGGTAIALRCGHRASIDFDFFADKELSHQTPSTRSYRGQESPTRSRRMRRIPSRWSLILATSGCHCLVD